MNKIEEDINHGLTRMDADNKKLPEGWEWKKLSELFTIRPQKKQVKEKLDDGDEISFVPMECLNADDRNLTLKQVKTLKDVYSGYTYFENNDVLLAKITPCFENGKVGIARNLQNGIGFGSSEFIVFRSQGEVIPEYLYYYLSQESFRQEGKAMMAGAVGHKRVSKDFINDYKLPFPESIEEQKRIVAILDEAYAAIDKAKANAEKNLANAKELFESYLNGIFSNPGEYWEEKRLYEITRCITDGDHMPPPKSDHGIPFITISNIDKNTNQINFSNTFFVPVEYYESLKENRKPRVGDILYTVTGSYGIPVLVDFDSEFCFQRHIGLIRPIDEVNPKLLYYWILSSNCKNQANTHATGTAQKTVSLGMLRNFLVPLIKEKEQNEIVNRLDLLSAETKNLESIYQQKITALDELKKSILKKAFEGEL